MLSQFPLTFSQTQKEMPFCIVLDCLPILNLIGALYLFLLLKLRPKKWSLVLFYEVFFLWSLLFISINLQYDLAWNTVVVSVATTTSSYLDMLDKVQKM